MSVISVTYRRIIPVNFYAMPLYDGRAVYVVFFFAMFRFPFFGRVVERYRHTVVGFFSRISYDFQRFFIYRQRSEQVLYIVIVRNVGIALGIFDSEFHVVCVSSRIYYRRTVILFRNRSMPAYKRVAFKPSSETYFLGVYERMIAVVISPRGCTRFYGNRSRFYGERSE